MKVSIISFTENGIRLSMKLAQVWKEAEITLYTKCKSCGAYETFHDFNSIDHTNIEEKVPIHYMTKSVGVWAGEQMKVRQVLIFIGACGIAVRAIAPYLTDKLHDSPVLVMDEQGVHIIPILSGHIGGANEIARQIAEKIGATPVITTATDLNDRFAVDLFAKKNGLFIVNKEGIAKVSSKVLAGETVTISIETGHDAKERRLPLGIQRIPYPPTQPVDILVTSENAIFDASIYLRPREYVIGMGCRSGKEAAQIEALIIQSMEALGISVHQILALASIDVKAKESGFLAWSRKENLPFVTYNAKQLQEVTGSFHTSNFVQEQVGVDNVCERAALKACGNSGTLVYEKHAQDGMTIAIARREWSVRLDET